MLIVDLDRRILLALAQHAILDDQELYVMLMKQRNASSGVQTIGSPRTLKLVLTSTAQPILALNLEIMCA
jgi:hypothetical protein